MRYVSSEEFTNDFINSIANNRGSAFQARYREVDILMIDDIQFLQGRTETQEAFFHTFNQLHDHNKQVVITSDVPPKHLTGFEERMRSRFEWGGLITDVQAPDLETRIAILRKKAQSEQLHVPDDVLEYIATKVSSNIRELEGALIRATAFANLNRSALDIATAQTALRDIVDQDEDSIVSPTDIITTTANYFKLPRGRPVRIQPVAADRDGASDRDVPVPRAHQPLPAEDRAALRQPRSHHGDVRVQEDQRAHEGAPGDLQPGDRDHRPAQPALTRTSSTASRRPRRDPPPRTGIRPPRTAPPGGPWTRQQRSGGAFWHARAPRVHMWITWGYLPPDRTAWIPPHDALICG